MKKTILLAALAACATIFAHGIDNSGAEAYTGRVE